MRREGDPEQALSRWGVAGGGTGGGEASPRCHDLHVARALTCGPFRVEYYNTRVREDIEDWPVDLLARCVAECF